MKKKVVLFVCLAALAAMRGRDGARGDDNGLLSIEIRERHGENQLNDTVRTVKRGDPDFARYESEYRYARDKERSTAK
jgi:hypothetical protein